MSKIVYPEYFRTVKREGNAWYFRHPRVFFTSSPVESLNLEQREERYGLTKEKVVIELFRLNAGKAGYYLANLRDREYYYCGLAWEDVKITLLSLGIGRCESIES